MTQTKYILLGGRELKDRSPKVRGQPHSGGVARNRTDTPGYEERRVHELERRHSGLLYDAVKMYTFGWPRIERPLPEGEGPASFGRDCEKSDFLSFFI